MEAKKNKIPVYLLRASKFYRTFDIDNNGKSWTYYAKVTSVGRRRTIREILGL